MNIMKSTPNTWYFCHNGPTSKENNQKNQIPYKNFTKLSIPNSYDENPNQKHKNPPKHNLRIKINNEKNNLRDINGIKNHSNWLGFDVKILKEGF